jgi:NAD-dependent deacetylase
MSAGPAHIFVLTGAGISAESGLGTFRDMGGVWTRYSWDEVASPEGYARDPQLVQDFYNARRANLLAASPNPAHAALARLELHQAATGGRLTLVTQNVDDLHERAGSAAPVHMHGELLAGWCLACGWRGRWVGAMPVSGGCPSCGSAGQVRPDVVWFGEIPYRMDEIEAALVRADLFVSIGTSGSVYPAAGFVATARELGIATLELNLERSQGAPLFDRGLYGPASEVVPAWVTSIAGEAVIP